MSSLKGVIWKVAEPRIWFLGMVTDKSAAETR